MKKVVSFAQKMGHAAILILEGVDQFAFGTHTRYIEAMIFKDLFEALLFPLLVRHLLEFSATCWIWV